MNKWRLGHFFITLVFALIFLNIFASCSDGRNSILVREEETLRSISNNRESGVLWTKEIENSSLTKDISRYENIINAASVSSESVVALSNEEAIFPEIERLGTLDTRNIPDEIFLELTSFIKKISNTEDAISFIKEENIYTYIFFLHDLKSQWEENFKQAYPAAKKIFTSYEIARPFVLDAVYEIPVRLYCNEGFIDIHIFFDSIAKKIELLEIIEWSDSHEK
ncbi:MAG: hypothetical protein IJR49_02335 [Treponema sp.]|nr:hypothetical protein [Treponema sp.]